VCLSQAEFLAKASAPPGLSPWGLQGSLVEKTPSHHQAGRQGLSSLCEGQHTCCELWDLSGSESPLHKVGSTGQPHRVLSK
jgi:hypothetical protein